MSVQFTLQNLTRNPTLRQDPLRAAAASAAPVVREDPRRLSDLHTARAELLELYDKILALSEVADARVRSSSQAIPGYLLSSSALGLDFTTRAARIDSTGELNTVSTSYSPTNPEWKGKKSTTQLTISGTYDGTSGAGQMEIRSQNLAVRGLQDTILRINDAAGATISTVTVNASDPVDTTYAIGNGLFLALGDGLTQNNERASVNIDNAVDHSIYTDNPFSGIGTSGANFDPNAAAIVAGSFSINGENISVATSDSLNDVLARINASAANVTATFDALSETVNIVNNTDGSSPTVSLTADDSNLLDALRLSGATVVAGKDADSSVALSTLASFAGVSAGNLTINGNSVPIDPATDSLDDVISKLNAASGDVDAVLSTATQLVSLFNNNDGLLRLSDGGTGLVAALNLAEGTFGGLEENNGISRGRAYRITDATEQVFDRLNRIFNDSTFSAGAKYISELRDQYASALSGPFAGLGDAEQGVFGLSIDKSNRAKSNGFVANIDRREFARSLQRDSADAKALLIRPNNKAGLISRLESLTLTALQNIGASLGIDSGIFSDTA